MAIWIYIAGVIAALVAAVSFICYEDKRLTVGTLSMAVICSLFSWFVLLAAIVVLFDKLVDSDKEIWRKKE